LLSRWNPTSSFCRPPSSLNNILKTQDVMYWYSPSLKVKRSVPTKKWFVGNIVEQITRVILILYYACYRNDLFRIILLTIDIIIVAPIVDIIKTYKTGHTMPLSVFLIVLRSCNDLYYLWTFIVYGIQIELQIYL